jgi:NSS family neurotransmitter:Na+ symporter
MAGLAVIPAAVATGLAAGVAPADIKLGSVSLLFVTLQDVFVSMGAIGPLFGVIFYLLVTIAAISSAISLVEVVATYFMDRAAQKGKEGNRPKLVLWICLAVMVEATIVAVDGLGSNGMWVPFQNSLGVVGAFNDCWLDFMDFWSEGVAMPLGALLMSIMVGWEIKPKTLLDEIHIGCNAKIDAFFSFCIKFIAPLGMILILLGQLNDFLALGIF